MAYLYRIAAYLLLAFAPIQLVYADFIAPEIVGGYIEPLNQPAKEGWFDNLGACKSWVEEGVVRAYYFKDYRWEGGKCPYPSRPSDISCHGYFASHSENDREGLGGCKVERKCPSNSKQNEDNTCTCLSGYVEKDRSCVMPKTCEAGKEIHRDFPTKGPSQLCDDVVVCISLKRRLIRVNMGGVVIM